MLLQLAIDGPEQLAVVSDLADLADIVEVGTPLLKRFGLSAISSVRELCPGKRILVDTKTVDGGALEAAPVFAAGGSIVTVLTRASEQTKALVAQEAKRHGASFFLDTICEADNLANWLKEPGLHPACECVNLHSPSDAGVNHAMGGEIRHAIATLRARGVKTSVAGRMGPARLPEIREWAPDIVVVGSAIFDADNPRSVAEWMKRALTAH